MKSNSAILKRGIFLLSLIVSISNAVFSQNKTKEHFDLKEFDKFRNDPSTNLSHSNFVMYEDSDNYVQRTRKKNSSIFEFKTFYKSTLFIKEKFALLYSIEIGVHEKYDEHGNLIKKSNIANDFKFSIKRLVQKIKERYGVDILIYNGSTSISRRKDKNGKPIYHVQIPKDKVGYEVLLIDLDGETGKIIKEQTIIPIED